MPGPNSGVHDLICVDKEGTACTKVVLQSRVRIWRWYVVGYAVVLPGRWWCSAWAFSLFSVFFSSACGWLSPLGALVFCGLVCCRPSASDASRRPPGERRVGSGCPPVLRVAPGSRCGGALPPSLLSLVIVDFLIVSVLGPFLRHFPSCGVPARWRDLRHVVLDICRK